MCVYAIQDVYTTSPPGTTQIIHLTALKAQWNVAVRALIIRNNYLLNNTA